MTFLSLTKTKTPLLARRGAEADERSESDEPACRQAGRGGRSFLFLPPRLQTLCGFAASVWIHPSWPGGEFI